MEEIEISRPPERTVGERPVHILEWMMAEVNRKLGTSAVCRAFHGEIPLSPEERARPAPLRGSDGMALPYWLIVAGGRADRPIKWWSAARFQQVVDRFRDRLLFAQVGAAEDPHPALRGVVDLRGCTGLRDLVHWTRHAQGVVCGITFLMHLSAAVENAWTRRRGRPCVVIAGGREPVHWFSYPGHQVLHTVGQLPCAGTGCWKSRMEPLGSGAAQDEFSEGCDQQVGGLARCMDLITAEDVARRIEGYVDGGVCRYLTSSEAAVARTMVTSSPADADPMAPPFPFPRGHGPLRLRPAISMPGESLFPGRALPQFRAEEVPASRLCVVTVCDAGMTAVGRESLPRLRAYARRHGFACRVHRRSLAPDRHPAWSKVAAVLRLIRSGRFDWVFWADADAFILNPEHDVRALISRDHDLITASDFNGLCSGLFLCRACEWSGRFLQTAWGLGRPGYDPDGMGDKWEQTAFKHLLAHFPEHRAHVAMVPETWMNSGPLSYRAGHFVLHLGGMSDEQRLAVLRRILAEDPEEEAARDPLAEAARLRRRLEGLPGFAS